MAGLEVRNPTNYVLRSDENSDGFYGSGYSALAIGVKLHAEARINSPHFAEGASEGSPSQARPSQLREKLPAPDQDFTTSAVNDCNLVKAVPRLDDQFLHILHAVNLH